MVMAESPSHRTGGTEPSKRRFDAASSQENRQTVPPSASEEASAQQAGGAGEGQQDSQPQRPPVEIGGQPVRPGAVGRGDGVGSVSGAQGGFAAEELLGAREDGGVGVVLRALAQQGRLLTRLGLSDR